MTVLARKHAPLLFYGGLCAILLLAAFLRVYQLGTESLWKDELATYRFMSMDGPLKIVEGSRTDNNFPTYYLILHYWALLFGGSEFSLRFPSALAGILTVFVMYRVGTLLFNRSVGLMASLLLALSPFHIYYSQEARVYSFVGLLGLLSFYFFVKLLNNRKLATRIGYVLSTSALMYSHVFALFILLAQNIYFATMFLVRIFRSRGKVRLSLGEWSLLQALLFVLYVPGLMLLVGWFSEPVGRAWIYPPSLNSVYESFVDYSGSPLLFALFLSFSLLAGVALVRSGGADKFYLLLVWLLTPVTLPVVLSSFSTPIFTGRYAIAATLAFYLLAAKGVEVTSEAFSKRFLRGLPEALKARIVWLFAATILMVLLSSELWSYFGTLNKPQWREVAQYVDTHAHTGDLVLIEGRGPQEELFNHYSKRAGIETETTEELGGGETTGPSIWAYERVWHVRPDKREHDEEELRSSKSVLKKGHTAVDDQRDTNIDFTLYEQR